MIYETRQMIARADLLHGGRFLQKGEQFSATEIDARYYEGHNMADPAPALQQPELPAAPPESTTPRRGRRSAAAPAAEPKAPATDESIVMGAATFTDPASAPAADKPEGDAQS